MAYDQTGSMERRVEHSTDTESKWSTTEAKRELERREGEKKRQH